MTHPDSEKKGTQRWSAPLFCAYLKSRFSHDAAHFICSNIWKENNYHEKKRVHVLYWSQVLVKIGLGRLQAQIRLLLLLEEQIDQGLHCFPIHLQLLDKLPYRLVSLGLFLFLAHLSRFRLIGELIVYPWSGVRPVTISNIFSSETAWPIKAKFYLKPHWVGRTKICSRHPGHMTKMVTTPISW